MNKENSKAQSELEVFKDFLNAVPMSVIDQSIRNGNANEKEPDIICQDLDGRILGYELTEACSEDWQREFKNFDPTSNKPLCFFHDEETINTVEKKLMKSYCSDYPIDLIIYSRKMTSLSFDDLKSEIETAVDNHRNMNKNIQFENIWLLQIDANDSPCKKVYPRQ